MLTLHTVWCSLVVDSWSGCIFRWHEKQGFKLPVHVEKPVSDEQCTLHEPSLSAHTHTQTHAPCTRHASAWIGPSFQHSFTFPSPLRSLCSCHGGLGVVSVHRGLVDSSADGDGSFYHVAAPLFQLDADFFVSEKLFRVMHGTLAG